MTCAGGGHENRARAQHGGSRGAAAPAAAIAHGGAGARRGDSDGCRCAVDAALAALERGAEPVDAAVAGVVVLEDDVRFNAGTGSRVRIDGETIQMDAAVMTSEGDFGAVAVIEKTRNPVRVARAVLGTPNILLAGDGATSFARSLGMPEYDPTTPEMKAKSARLVARLRAADPSLPEAWRRFDWRARWNFARSLEEAGLGATEIGSDTVGVAVRAADGRFGAALSTGGTALTLRGRVGDVPVPGAGLYAGPGGAVAATGSGERILEAGLARRVYGMLSQRSPQEAAESGVAELAERGSIGLIVLGRDALGAACNRSMAWAGRALGADAWLGP